MPPRSTHVQPGDVSHALIQQGERERLGKTPSSSSTTACWWWRSVAIPQGFAKHRGRGGGGGRAARGRGKLMCLQPPMPQLYIGEREGSTPPLGFPPQGVRQPQSHLRVAAKGGEGGNLPPKLGGSTPSPNPRRLGPLWGAHQPTWGWFPPNYSPLGPSGQVDPPGGPPEPLRWSRYNTGDPRNSPDGRNCTSYI